MPRSQPFSFEEFKQIYSKVPRICVEVIIKKDNKYLLTLRQKHGYVNQWHFPGGTIYYLEHIQDAVKRVAKEELGVDVVVDKFLGYIEYPSELKERGFGYTISLAFICTTSNEEYKLDSFAEKAEYFDTPPDNMIVEQKEFLNNLINKIN